MPYVWPWYEPADAIEDYEAVKALYYAVKTSHDFDAAVIAIYAMYREFLGISKGAGLYVCPSTETSRPSRPCREG